MSRPLVGTYRVQLHPGFTFDDAVGTVDHLHRLGVSHLYTSPVLAAVPGSTHGYDVTDHSAVRDELGGDAGLRRLVAALRERGMGWIVDLVPNHVSVAHPERNPRWWDLLRHGRSSASAPWFDVDWSEGDDRVVLPVLGRSLDDELRDGALAVRPAGADVPDQEAIDGAARLVLGYHDLVVPLAEGTVTARDVGCPPARLRDILAAQHYRLSWWRAGDRNYRVFFDIDSLAAVRVEDEQVFDGVHQLLAEWVDDDLVDGVRIDHIDGLADPAGYLDRLRRLLGADRYLWVEKILVGDELLPSSWPVDGTTGYDAATWLTRVLVDPSAGPILDRLWHERADDARPYDVLEREAKRQVVSDNLSPDLDRTVRAGVRANIRTVAGDVVEADALRAAVVELAVALEVYRTYGVGAEELAPVDAERLDAAAALAAGHTDVEVLAAICERLRQPVDAAGVAFRTRFQQLSAPALAKGAEDTAFYRYLRCTALNEVGGDPGVLGADVDEFHAWASRRPPTDGSLVAASTHDTKRSADVRARLAALTHEPARWAEALAAWETVAGRHRTELVDRETEYLLWQTVVGAWPIDDGRLLPYLQKATREAKRRTTWTDPSADYEAAISTFARAVLADTTLVRDVDAHVQRWAMRGRALRLAEVVLRHTLPGVPDCYQGDQDWDTSLVDPDNRRPVDHSALDARLTEALRHADVEECGLGDGSLAKLWTVSRLLRLRRNFPEFAHAAYRPVEAGAGAVAFLRGPTLVVAAVRPGHPHDRIELDVERRDILRRDRVHRAGAHQLGAIVGDAGVAVLVPH